MHILIITPEYPFPINSGGRMRTWSFINALRHQHQVSLMFPENAFNPPQKDLSKHEIFQNVWAVPINPNRHKSAEKKSLSTKLYSRLRNFVGSVPWEITSGYREELEAEFLEVMERNQIDMIFIRYLNNGQYIFRNRRAVRKLVLIDLDDLPTIYLERNLKNEKFSGAYDRFRRKLNVIMTGRYLKNLRSIDQVFVCSEADKQYVLQKKWTHKVSVVPNTININNYQDVDDYSKDVHAAETILFCGHLGYQPNVDAMRWFVIEVLPRIVAQIPQVKVLFVGSNPGENTKQIPAHPAVFFHYNVPSMSLYYQKASLFIVPILSGGGTRVKILEALACRRPIVTTALGAEGLDVKDQKHCLIADDPDKFAQRCIYLLKDFKSAEQITRDGFQLVNQHYCSSIIEREILRVFEDVNK